MSPRMRFVFAALFAVSVSACATASNTVPTPPVDTAPVDTTGSSAKDTTATPPAEGTSADATPTAEGPDRKADAAVRARLAELPRCAEGAVVGQLTIAPGRCTLKFCTNACCNQCTWDAEYQTKGGPERVSKELVRGVLALPEAALDCEVAAWNAALAGTSVGLENGGCLVR